MVREIHMLLTYTCTFSCDHCFWFSGPDSKGTFTLGELEQTIGEIAAIGTVKWIYFEGGEPFLYYPLLLEGVRMARKSGLGTGIVTNAYWATSPEDAAIWLEPLKKLRIFDLNISDDPFHCDGKGDRRSEFAVDAARALGIPVNTICVEKPSVDILPDSDGEDDSWSIGGGVMFRGRAVEKLTGELPKKPWYSFTRCPHEDLRSPERIHMDPYGNVHLCQGLSMGNMRETPLSVLLREYDASAHPICGALEKGGPALLAKESGVGHEKEYVDACHFCYFLRLALMERFPQYLCPPQVYGGKKQHPSSSFRSLTGEG